eukprot:GHVO01009187.1.p2 GENE.GHVO01009187.1~~GHVO01009187.1.p2  ORF type:complete len:110 (-),score=0.38 GHVO01009187.1:566-895(-)
MNEKTVDISVTSDMLDSMLTLRDFVLGMILRQRFAEPAGAIIPVRMVTTVPFFSRMSHSVLGMRSAVGISHKFGQIERCTSPDYRICVLPGQLTSARHLRSHLHASIVH